MIYVILITLFLTFLNPKNIIIFLNPKVCFSFQLTPEDEERRRRRRERNKIAATKCRLKKRERTANLIQESEILETQNIDLKNQLHVLQKEQLTLTEMLSQHRPLCQHSIGPVTRDHLYRLPPVSSVMETHSYSRSPSLDSSYRTHYLDGFSSRNAMGMPSNISSRSNFSNKPPSIIIDEINENYDFGPLSDIESFSYSSPCHNYSGSQPYSSSGIDNGCMAWTCCCCGYIQIAKKIFSTYIFLNIFYTININYNVSDMRMCLSKYQIWNKCPVH